MRLCAALVSSLLLLAGAAAQDLPSNAAELPVSQLLTLAASALSAGRSVAALEIYDHVLARAPDDFATLFKRATIRLATGQLARAKDGFREVLAVKQFDQAHLQLARIHAKLGELSAALESLDSFLALGANQSNAEAVALRIAIIEANANLVAARAAQAATPQDLARCISASTDAIAVSPNSEELRLIRAECQLLSHEWDSTVGDLSRAAALSPALSPHLLIRLSLISGLFLDQGLQIPVDSLASLKRCLSSDPESKVCRVAFKAMKSLEKELAKLRNWIESGRWGEATLVLKGTGGVGGAINNLEALIARYQSPLPGSSTPSPLPSSPTLAYNSPLLTSLYSTLCRAYVTLNQHRRSSEACEEVLKRNPDDLWGMVGRGERLMSEENWEEAVRVLNDAFEKTGRADRDVLARLQKAQRLLKQSTAKDYYKVLGVSRDADAKTIKRAYRKATLKAHPDKGGSESAMQAVNEAYEVLSKPELKERFDNGEDPNDSAQQQQQQNPFAQGGGFQHFFQQGGQPFGGGGFKVKFG